MAFIELQGISKHLRYKNKLFSIDRLDLTIPDSKTVVIVGPTGCGKSTLLRLIAGLEKPDSGQILFNGRDMGQVPPSERKIGMVFQSLALYPHFTARENILSHFFFTKKKQDYQAIVPERLEETSRLLEVDIAYLLDRKPSHLSGGEKQRVALGRCITRDPQVFLLDEPFAHLDTPLRHKYRLHLKQLLRKFSITTVYVTHDQEEAFLFADMVAVMRDGRIEQTGAFHDIYENPCNQFVAEFLTVHQNLPALNVIDGTRLNPSLRQVNVGVRPTDIAVHRAPQEKYLPALVTYAAPQAEREMVVLELSLGGQVFHVPVAAAEKFRPQETVWVECKKFLLFDARTGKRL